jgi:hypothetical protein
MSETRHYDPGSEVGVENWALLASIVATCKLNDVNPVAYIAQTLEAIIAGHPQSRIEDLMPWRFSKTSSQHQIGAAKRLPRAPFASVMMELREKHSKRKSPLAAGCTKCDGGSAIAQKKLGCAR